MKTHSTNQTLNLKLDEQRLLEMSQKYTHKKVLIVNEAYTTRTCGNCFVVNNNVGASKVFCCVHCDLEADRDVHAARNILLRYVPDLFVLPDALKSGASKW